MARFSSTVFLAMMTVGALAGCGGGSGGGTQTTSPQSTLVTVLSTSTGNDQLTRFNLVVNSLTLTGASGASATIISTPLQIESIHVNGISEPLLTVGVPPGIYTSATASIGGSDFTCVSLNGQGALSLADFAYQDSIPASQVMVDLPAPITISGGSMGLLFNLLVSKSASWTTCDPTPNAPFSITPTFNLTSFPLSGSPTNTQNGLETGLKGIVTSVETSTSFSVMADDGHSCAATAQGCALPKGPTWQITSNGATAFQGIAGQSELIAGMPVDMDAALQPDGSLLAKRVSVYDTGAENLTTIEGPLTYQSANYPYFNEAAVDELGPLNVTPVSGNSSSAVFHISGAFTNLADLPFTPAFGPTSVADGQNIYATTHALFVAAAPTYAPASSLTLLPQTINGTVKSISSDSGFSTYTITLAPYDLFPELAVQGGQRTAVTNPNTVVVYADSNTQQLNTNPIAVGSVVRFYGLVFNDNGTLRMDCAQINDGVPE